jgi:hypothetical protein
MTDREYREQKARICKLIGKWVGPLGLKWWSLNFTYSREPLESGKGESYACLGTCTADWEYLTAQITFNLPALSKKSDADLEECFVHELCHVFVNEMRMWGEKEMPTEKHDEAMHHEERTVTQLANAFLWLRKHAYEEGHKVGKTQVHRKALRRGNEFARCVGIRSHQRS